MYLLQVVTIQRQAFDNACGAVTTQATQGPTTQRGPATTDDDIPTESEACTAAIGRLRNNAPAICTSNSDNAPDGVCSECRGFYEDIAAICEFNVSFLLSKITGFITYQVILQVTTLCIPYSLKFSKTKIFVDFVVFKAPTKILSLKISCKLANQTNSYRMRFAMVH